MTRGTPRFKGHYQPRLPGDLGFYDLRVADVQREQAELAKLYGIHGFCYYHYWFGGKRLLEKPVNQLLENPDIDLPFCLCWANENWTRRWDGLDSDVLIAQDHSPEDDIAFIQDLSKYLKDSRYIKFDGKPVLLVYRVDILPEPKETVKRWRDYCRAEGVGELYLVAARSFGIEDPTLYGFDAAVEFPPHCPSPGLTPINEKIDITDEYFTGNIYSYDEMRQLFVSQGATPYPLIKTVCPSWDNEARKNGRGDSFFGATSEKYAEWLTSVSNQTIEQLNAQECHPDFVFINAWNEWAEGTHLEPDKKYGYASLHTTASVLTSYNRPANAVLDFVESNNKFFERKSENVICIHLYYEHLLEEIMRSVENVTDADVIISVQNGVSLSTLQAIAGLSGNCFIMLNANKGRDILPFLSMTELVKKLGYKYGLKLHSKKSPHRVDGNEWRQNILSSLLPSRKGVSDILHKLKSNSTVGMLGPPDSLFNQSEHPEMYLGNTAWLNRMLVKMGRQEQIGQYDWDFVAGSMYWFNVEALPTFAELGISQSDFEPELGQLDGTLAHAVERISGLVLQDNGFEVLTI